MTILFKKIYLIILLYSYGTCFYCQNESNIESYIPQEYSSLKTHPVIQLKTFLHVVYKSKDEPNNILANDLKYINQQYQWINNSYKNLKTPTLLPDNRQVHYIPDARITFRLDTIIVHYDSIAWDRIYYGLAMNGNLPWKIEEIDLNNNSIKIKGRWSSLLKSRGDSLAIGGAGKNNGTYHTRSFFTKDNNTYITLKEPLASDTIIGNITYFKKIDKNCWKDNWEKLAGSDKNAIHIFYTGATSNQPAFGCGPSPYFLNLSKLNLNGDFASASLTAHELGHCLGLRHTNVPQFDDLSSSDKFGFIPCDTIATSNNIMGYNKCRNYLSPKQIGFIHKNYSTDTTLIKTTANGEYNANKNIKIWTNKTWNRAILISGDIIIKPGRTLTIKNMLSMAKGANIYLSKNAKLIIDGGLITNNHGEKWGNIIICKSYNKKERKPCRKKNYGKTVFLNNGAIKNYTPKTY